MKKKYIFIFIIIGFSLFSVQQIRASNFIFSSLLFGEKQNNNFNEKIALNSAAYEALKEEEREIELTEIKSFLTLNPEKVKNINELLAEVDFKKTVDKAIIVGMTFNIFDQDNKLVHSEKEFITIENDEVFLKKFKTTDLSGGTYLMSLEIFHGEAHVQKIEQEFEILKTPLEKLNIKKQIISWCDAWWKCLIFLISIVVIIILIISFLIKRNYDKQLN